MVVRSSYDTIVAHSRMHVYADDVFDSTSQDGLSRVLTLEAVCGQLLVSDLLLLLLLCLLLLVEFEDLVDCCLLECRGNIVVSVQILWQSVSRRC